MHKMRQRQVKENQAPTIRNIQSPNYEAKEVETAMR